MIAGLLLLAGVAVASPAAAVDAIRVGLAEGIPTAEIGGGPLVLQRLTGPPLFGQRPTWLRLAANPRGVEIRVPGRRALVVRAIRLQGERGGAVRFEGRDYPGVLEIQHEAGGLRVVNEVPLEEYLAGSVKAEAGDEAPIEMLKAQAVAARTYAAYHQRLNAGKPFHLGATTAHQQYAGRVTGDSPVWRAVRETRGQVLLWEGNLFPAFYHTDSGGHTEDPRTVFGAANMPAIPPVRVEFPSDSPHHRWTLVLPLAELGGRLQRGGVGVGRVESVEVVERSASLRAARVGVRGTEGTVVLRGNEFRRLLGYDTLKSTLFAVAVDGMVAHFSGRGYGHGVGLDQAAARTMALLGYSARDILAYYYPGATLSSLARLADAALAPAQARPVLEAVGGSAGRLDL